jgi:hypothetical protein
VGQGRTPLAYALACWLVRDLALADAVALNWMKVLDHRHAVPLGEGRLVQLLADAHAYGRNAVGCGLKN